MAKPKLTWISTTIKTNPIAYRTHSTCNNRWSREQLAVCKTHPCTSQTLKDLLASQRSKAVLLITLQPVANSYRWEVLTRMLTNWWDPRVCRVNSCRTKCRISSSSNNNNSNLLLNYRLGNQVLSLLIDYCNMRDRSRQCKLSIRISNQTEKRGLAPLVLTAGASNHHLSNNLMFKLMADRKQQMSLNFPN